MGGLDSLVEFCIKPAREHKGMGTMAFPTLSVTMSPGTRIGPGT